MKAKGEDRDGSHSWFDAGFHLAIHWWGEVDVADRAPAARALRELPRTNPEQAVVDWARRFLPNVMLGVPERSHRQVAQGFLKRIEQAGR